MIPKTIHYCWFGKKELPPLADKCIKSWKHFCPDYEIVLWNEDNFDLNCCDYVKEAYDQKKYAFVSDYVRLKVVYEYGGIYLDTDVELLKTIDEYLTIGAFYGIEYFDGVTGYIATGLGFGAEKGHYTVKAMLDEYQDIHFVTNAGMDLTTCPIRNTKSLIKYGVECLDKTQYLKDFNVYSSEYFCPLTYFSTHANITSKTVSIHHYQASWTSNKDKIERKFYSFIYNVLGDTGGKRFISYLNLPKRIYNKIRTIGIKRTIVFYMNKFKRS